MIARLAFEVEPIVDALGRDAVVVVEGVLDTERVIGQCQLSAPTGILIGPGEAAQVLMLGYNIFPPFMGYVEGRFPRRFLPRAPADRPS